MPQARRRKIAWLFALVLLLELALLCCASAHLTDHVCRGHDDCAICACVREGLRRAAVTALLLTALAALSVSHAGTLARRFFARGDSLFDRRVRLND